jgi:DNA-binding XRE family transcriptional regulator
VFLYPVEIYPQTRKHWYMATNQKPSGKTREPLLTDFGMAVRRRRKALGYSQEGFGDACGIDRSYMGGIERGEHNVALINIMKIINALGLEPSEFFRELDRRGKA